MAKAAPFQRRPEPDHLPLCRWLLAGFAAAGLLAFAALQRP